MLKHSSSKKHQRNLSIYNYFGKYPRQLVDQIIQSLDERDRMLIAIREDAIASGLPLSKILNSSDRNRLYTTIFIIRRRLTQAFPLERQHPRKSDDKDVFGFSNLQSNITGICHSIDKVYQKQEMARLLNDFSLPIAMIIYLKVHKNMPSTKIAEVLNMNEHEVLQYAKYAFLLYQASREKASAEEDKVIVKELNEGKKR